MGIYRDLIYNNIEGFLNSGFPVLCELHDDDAWHALVREFIVNHQCHTPYFLEISQEFLRYLQQHPMAEQKPYLVELAHYEWVELALDVSAEEFPPGLLEGDLMERHPVVSPLAWNLSYQFPVHKIDKHFQPSLAETTPTFLVVYRNHLDQVKFMESNAATSRLLNLLEGDANLTGRQALILLADEMSAPNIDTFLQYGSDILAQLRAVDVICGCR